MLWHVKAWPSANEGSMDPVSQSGAVSDATADQLEEYGSQNHERDFVLTGVRQPEEYALGHIPEAAPRRHRATRV